jgi:curved DNA-binding protein CbpA
VATDFYAILAVARDATQEQIRARFLELARSRHPDRFKGQEKAAAETEFQAITEAFNVLSNPQRRRQLDFELSQPEINSRGVDSEHLVRVLMQRGAKAYKERDFREAASNFDRATQSDPENAQAWHYLALACGQQPRWLSRGMVAIAKACELDRMNVSYLKLAGRLFTEGGMPLRAEKYYRQALQWAEDDPEISVALEELKKAK